MVAQNSASVSVGTGGALLSAGGGAALATLSRNSGSLSLATPLTSSAALTNSGTIVLAESGSLQALSYTQTGGTTSVAAGATLKAGSSGTGGVIITGGALAGNGKVLGAVAGAGTITPGRAAGPLTVTGTYKPASTGRMAVGIGPGSTVGTSFGRLAVSGTATLAGTLAIQTEPGYVPAVGTVVTVLTAGSRTGTFATVAGAQLSARHWKVSYTTTSVVLTMVAG